MGIGNRNNFQEISKHPQANASERVKVKCLQKNCHYLASVPHFSCIIAHMDVRRKKMFCHFRPLISLGVHLQELPSSSLSSTQWSFHQSNLSFIPSKILDYDVHFQSFYLVIGLRQYTSHELFSIVKVLLIRTHDLFMHEKISILFPLLFHIETISLIILL